MRVLANGYQNIYIQTFDGGEKNATGSSSGHAGQQRADFLVRQRPPLAYFLELKRQRR